jgi:hypothetical protein
MTPKPASEGVTVLLNGLQSVPNFCLGPMMIK